MKTKIGLLFIFFNVFVFGQVSKIDSLKKVLNKSKVDTSKINTLNALASELFSNNPDTCIYLSNQALVLSKKNNYTIGIAESNANIGFANYFLGKTMEAIRHLKLADSIAESLNDASISINRKQKLLGQISNGLGANYVTIGKNDLAKVQFEKYLHISEKLGFARGVGNAYLNIAVIEQVKGNYSGALKKLFEGLKKLEQSNEPKLIATVYNNIGAIYTDMNDYPKALDYLSKTLSLAKSTNQLLLVSNCYYSRGLIYFQQNKLELTLTNALEAYKIGREINNAKNIINALVLIGRVYREQGKYEKGLEKLFEGLKIAEDSEDIHSMPNILNSISETYFKSNDIDKAIRYGEEAYTLALKSAEQPTLQEACENLATYYTKTGDYKKALEMKTLAVNTRDSIMSESNQKELMNQEFKYTYDKQAIADSLKYDNDKKIQSIETQANLRTQRNKQIALSIGLLLAIVSGAILYNRFKVIQKQKNLIETQSKRLELAHLSLEEKSKEIQDSIVYSKEIQNIFLKSITNNDKYFQNSILIYKPKAVVSGDFYWYKEINENLFVVIGDCTGHGVPGAIISVLAIQSLEKAIKLLKDFKNLHELNELMNNEFNSYYEAQRHIGIGLDFSVICINKKENKLYLSGSGGTVILKTNQQQIINKKFESINIGGEMPISYNPITLLYNIDELMSVFLYTDGIIDQKEEKTGKKIGTKKLTRLLSELKTNKSDEALHIIETTLSNWQGGATQIDDMTLLGIQFNS